MKKEKKQKKDCKKNLEEMKSKLEKEYQEKIEMEKKRGQEELRIMEKLLNLMKKLGKGKIKNDVFKTFSYLF